MALMGGRSPCGGTALYREGSGSYTDLPGRTENDHPHRASVSFEVLILCSNYVRVTTEENWVKGPSSLQLPMDL